MDTGLDLTLELELATKTPACSPPAKPVAPTPILCSLCDLPAGESATVQQSPWHIENCALLESYGFFPESSVTRMGSAPQGDPLIFRLDRRLVALRRETAAKILVLREDQ